MSLIARTSEAGFGARWTRLRFLCEYSLGLGVIDDSHRIAALTLRCAINTRRQVGFMLGSVSRFRCFRLSGKIAGEAIFPAGKLNPFLGERRSRNREHKGRRNQRHYAHDLILPMTYALEIG